MFQFLRRLLGIDHNNPQHDNANIEARPDAAEPELYGGSFVPSNATRDPNDAGFYPDWFEQFDIVPAKDGKSILVFPREMISEPSTGGEPEMRPFHMARDDDYNPLLRIHYTIRMYERLFADGSSHPYVAQFLGPTPSGYRLERLRPGPFPWIMPKPSTSDCLLALYQRWAIQLLSALVFIHDKGIILNAPFPSSLWLREDFSLALVGIVSAGCIELDIPGVHWLEWRQPRCPWHIGERSLEPPFTHDETGHPKGDIFNWATWVYSLMSGGGNPLVGGDAEAEEELGQSNHAEFSRREKAARRGEFHDWPELDTHLLGPQLLRAWRGEYESAAEVLEDVVKTLEERGRRISTNPIIDLLGFDWAKEFDINKDTHGKFNEQLCLRDVGKKGEVI